MIQFVNATSEHIRQVALNMRDRDVAEFSALSYLDRREDIAESLVTNYAGVSGITAVLLDGEPVAIGGAVWVRPDVASLLFYATDAFPKIVIALTRYARDEVITPAKLRAHRIECFSLSTYTVMQQWVETLGLKRECTLRQYGKRREDFIVYAWLRGQE